MNRTLCIICTSFTLAAAGLAETSHPELSAAVRQAVEAYAESGEFVGGVTLVAEGGQILDLQAHGVKDLASGEPVEPDSIFKIHSFTKAMTSAAALMLFEEGKFQFDDPVSRWIPSFGSVKVKTKEAAEPVPAERPMLVRHLFTHSSGLSYKQGDVFDGGGNLATIVDAIAERPLEFEPGTAWEYGLSIDVLGRLVEIWSGEEFSSFLDARLIRPLGMTDTAFHVPQSKDGRRVVIHGSTREDSTGFTPTAENDSVPRETPEFCMPGGGLYSTATDYFRFLRMICQGGESDGHRYLRPETVKLMTRNQLPESIGWLQTGGTVRDGFGYGFGFNTVVEKSEWDPDARPGECGWGGKASCHYWFHPESGIIVVTLEQIIPYRRSLETALKGAVYGALSE